MATAWVRIRPDTRVFHSDLQKSAATSGTAAGKKFSGAFGGVMKAMVATVGFAGMVAGVSTVYKAMVNLDREAAVIKSTIKATGGAANVSADQVSKLASSISGYSGIGKVAILQSEKILLTFRGIRNETGKGNRIFDQATVAVANMATTMGQDLGKTAIMVGKALQDPVKGVTSLRRVGVMLDDQQMKSIKTFMAQGNVMGAQKVILGELSKEFGGAAKAAGKSFGGQIQRLKNTLVGFGVVVMKMILPYLKSAIDLFMGMPGPLKVAAIAITALGIAMKVAAVANPWLLLAAAIVTVIAIIIKNWSKVKAFLIASWEAIKKAWSAVCGAISKAWSAVVHGLRTAIAWVVNKILGYYGMILHGAAWAFGWIPGIGPKLKAAAKWFDKFRADVTDSIAGIHGKTVTVGVNLATQKRWQGVGAATGGYVKGLVRGPGGPKADKAGIFALSNREFVMQAAAVERYGVPFMEAVNAGRLAGGGLVVKARTPSKKSIDTDIWSAVKRAANSMASALFSFGGIGGSGVERWRGLVQQVLRMLGQSLSWTNAVLQRIRMESGGNPRAINLWDINAQRGDPSRGLMQTIGSTFNAYAGRFRSRGIYDPFANIFAGVNYALHRYGGLWVMTRPGGYGKGGLVSYDHGGRINESIFGIGRSGQAYRFAKGERVEPSAASGPPILNFYLHPTSNPAEVGAAVVKAIKAHETRSGKGWRS